MKNRLKTQKESTIGAWIGCFPLLCIICRLLQVGKREVNHIRNRVKTVNRKQEKTPFNDK